MEKYRKRYDVPLTNFRNITNKKTQFLVSSYALTHYIRIITSILPRPSGVIEKAGSAHLVVYHVRAREALVRVVLVPSFTRKDSTDAEQQRQG